MTITRNCPKCGKNGVPRKQGDGNNYCPYCSYKYKDGEVIE